MRMNVLKNMDVSCEEITYKVRIYAMSEAMTWRKWKDRTAIDKKTFWKVLPQKYKIKARVTDDF